MRAYRHIDDLDDLINRYGEELSVRYEPIVGDIDHVRAVLYPRSPPMIPCIIGDAVHNLRSALDLMICDIGRVRSAAGVDRLAFPFAKSKNELLSLVKRKALADFVGQDIVEAICELAPYAEGNKDLYGLHELDIIDKHRLIIPTQDCYFSDVDMGPLLSEQVSQFLPEGQKLDVLYLAGNGNPFKDRILDKVGSPVSADPIRRKHIHLAPKPAAFLFENNYPFAGQHVVPTLRRLAEMSDEIVASFSERF